MNTRWGAVVMSALVACGGGGSSAKENEVCEHAAKLCGAEDDVASCRGDLAKAKSAMGDAYGKFLDCSRAAKSCGEYVGCAIGGLGTEALDQLDGLGKGMKKMMKDELGDLPGLDDIKNRVKHEVREAVGDDELPATCKRIDTVCAPDEPFVRRECRRMVQNLGQDTANLGELSSCIAGANNCYALRACVDKMEAKLRGF